MRPGTGNGNVVLNPGGANGDPVVSDAGNSTGAFELYLSVGGVTLTIPTGGELTVGSNLVTGQWGDSGDLTVSGGTLTVAGNLLLGNGGFDGDLVIDSGAVTIGTLSINTTGGARLDILDGEISMPDSNLANVNFWITNGDIVGYGGTGTVIVDDTSNPGTLILTAQTGSSVDDTFWTGAVSNSWSDAGNWDNGLPGIVNGDAVINPNGANGDPVVLDAGNSTGAFDLFLSVGGATLTIPTGGELTVGANLITGEWGNSGDLTVSGGTLTVVDTLLLGNGGYDGDLVIDSGTVTIGTLSINTTGGARLDILDGEISMPDSNLANVNFWIGNGDIVAYGGTGTVILDDTSNPGTLILTGQSSSSVTDWQVYY